MEHASGNLADVAAWFRAYAAYRAWMRRSLPENRAGRVAAGDIKVHYHSYGSGPPVLLLHGGFMFAESWAAQVPGLAGSYEAVTIDSRGHGMTTLGDGPLTYDRMAEDASRVMERLGTGPSHVIGWSDGGCTAIALALQHPELVRSLVLIGTPYNIENYTREGWKRMESLLRPGSLDMLGLRAAWSALAPEPERWRDFADAMRRMWRTLPDFSVDDLGRVSVPTLVMACDRDEFLSDPSDPLKVFRETAEAIPRAEMRLIPGGGHGALMRRPAEVNAAILDFLATLRGRSDSSTCGTRAME